MAMPHNLPAALQLDDSDWVRALRAEDPDHFMYIMDLRDCAMRAYEALIQEINALGPGADMHLLMAAARRMGEAAIRLDRQLLYREREVYVLRRSLTSAYAQRDALDQTLRRVRRRLG